MTTSGERGRVAPSGEWWASYFDARYLTEYEPLFNDGQDRRDVARLIDLLALPVGARVLDVPCGQGRHARLLAEAGYAVDALDYSAHLLAVARAQGPRDGLHYRRGDPPCSPRRRRRSPSGRP